MVVKHVHKQTEEGKQAKLLIYRTLVRKLNASKSVVGS